MPVPLFKLACAVSYNLNYSNKTVSLTVQFDYSGAKNYDHLVWNFGDGTDLVQTVKSSETSIYHTYTIPFSAFILYRENNRPQFTVLQTAINGPYLQMFSMVFEINYF